MSTFVLKRKSYTVYDRTDALKKMKDSDVLAEREQKKVGYGDALGSAAGGALIGAGIGAGGYALTKGITGGFGNLAKNVSAGGFKTIGGIGAGVGALAAGISALRRRSKKNEDVEFYNDRLQYAQRQARRREHHDWKSNMTQREGYSF